MTVRDSAFQESRDIHRLCVIASGEDPTAMKIFDRLTDWQKEAGKDLNIEVLRLDASDSGVVWKDFGIPSAPPQDQLPAVVLAGRHHADGRSFFIDYWMPGPSDEELTALAGSTTRGKLQELLPKSIAVLLYVPGTGDGSGAAEEVLNKTVAKWKEIGPVEIVRVDRDDESERLLRAFTGVQPQGPDWVGIVFGRGKFMNPPLEGTQITTLAVDETVEAVVAKCTCLNQAAKMGVDLPMRWAEALDEQVVKIAVSTEAEADATKVSDAAVAELEELLTKNTDAEEPLLASTAPVEESGGGLQTALLVLAGLFVALVVSTVAVLRRRHA